MRSYLGIEIGGTKLQLVIGDEHARILDRCRFSVDAARGAEGIRQQIRTGLQQFRLHAVSAIGIGFGGPVDATSGQVLTSYQIPGWGAFRLPQWLEELTGIPAWIDNDANVAALGEALYGAGKGHRRVFYVTLGSGVGAGAVIDGALYHSGRNSEMEFGHIRLDKTGRILESSCSGWAVDRKVKAYADAHRDSLLNRLTQGWTTGHARALGSALEEKDAAALQILSETAEDFAFGLSHVIHLFNPDAVVLGGGLSMLGEPLRTAIADKVPAYLMDVVQPGPPVYISALGEDVVPIGALSLAINKLLTA